MRHSLFFREQQHADRAETWINANLAEVVETWQGEDEEPPHVQEVRFYTEEQLPPWDEHYLLSNLSLHLVSYSLNCQD